MRINNRSLIIMQALGAGTWSESAGAASSETGHHCSILFFENKCKKNILNEDNDRKIPAGCH